METRNVKEDIKKLANFAIRAQKIGPVWSFKSLEEELDIPKPKIIEILDLFRKAEIFEYQIMPWDPGDEDYDIAPTKEMIERRTGGFTIGNIDLEWKKKSDIQTDEIRLKELIDSPKQLDLFLKKFYRLRGTPKLLNKTIVWGDVVLPIERGHYTMMGIFLENPRIISPDGKTTKKGVEINREELEQSVPYRDEGSFRSALKKLRRKLKDSGMPITIENFTTNKYIIQIKKVDE